MASPLGTILGSINMKSYILEKDFIDKEYNPFIVNKSLSYFVDCILFVNEVDKLPNASKYDQYLFYYYSIPKGKRFKKWDKKDDNKYNQAVMEYYNVSNRKARDFLKILNENQLQEIEKMIDKGGKR